MPYLIHCMPYQEASEIQALCMKVNWHCALGVGLLLKPYLVEVSGLKLKSTTLFEWSGASGPSQASQYLPYRATLKSLLMNMCTV